MLQDIMTQMKERRDGKAIDNAVLFGERWERSGPS